MEIVERPEVAQELLRKAQSHKPERPKGWHQSDHNQCLRKSVMYHFLGRSLEEHSEGTQLLFALGDMSGSYLSEGMEEEVFWAPEFGWCSIDRPWTDEYGNVVPMELKNTRFSAAHSPLENVQYICQLATYVAKKALRAPVGILALQKYTGFLYTIYRDGDYKGDRLPEQRCFEFYFTGAELLRWNKELDRRHSSMEDSLDWLRHMEATDLGFQMEAEKVRDLVPTEQPDQFLELLPAIEDHYAFECEKYRPCPLKELISCPGTAREAKWDELPFVVTHERYTRVEKPSKKKV